MSFANGDVRAKIVILGALSAIAEAAARQWAEQGAHLLLVGRDATRLDVVAADLRVRGAAVETRAANLAESDAAEMFKEKAFGLRRVDTGRRSDGVYAE